MHECPACGGELDFRKSNDNSQHWAECIDCEYESPDFSSKKQLIEYLQKEE